MIAIGVVFVQENELSALQKVVMNKKRTYIDVSGPGAFACSVCGALVTFVGYGIYNPSVFVRSVESDGMITSYSELVVVVLAALTAILAVLGLFIAILAIWGYKQILASARSAADEAATKVISRSLEDDDGVLRQLVLERLGRKGKLYKELKEEVYKGIAQWEASGYDDPVEGEEEERE